MPFSPFGDPVYGLADAKVAPRTAVGVYTTPLIDVMSVQMMSATIRNISAELTGDDQITAVASRGIAGQFTIRFGGASLEVLACILGITPFEAATVTPNQVTTLTVPGGQRMPSFGIVGLGKAEDGLGDQLIFVPNAKVTGDITLGAMEYGAFQTIEFSAIAVNDGKYGIVNLIKRESSIEIAMPPVGIVAA